MEFSGKSKCIVELGRERLSNPLGNYYIFISPSFKYPSGRDRPNLVKCTPQLAPCPCVIATRLAPCTCVSDTCSQGEPPRRAVRRKYGGSTTLLTSDLDSPCSHYDPPVRAVSWKYAGSNTRIKGYPDPSSIPVPAPCAPSHQTLVPVPPVWNRTPNTPVPASLDPAPPSIPVLELCSRTPKPYGPATNTSSTPVPASAIAIPVPVISHAAPPDPLV